MKDIDQKNMSWDEFDETIRPAPETTDFDRVVEAAMSRRGFLQSIVAFGSGAAALGMGTMMGATSARAQAAAMGRFAFTPIDIQTDFTVHVPEGYTWKPLASWGDALFSDAPAFDKSVGGSLEASSRVFGDNTDGIELFNIDGHEVIAVNHEYTNPEWMLPTNTDNFPVSLAEVQKYQAVQGVTVMEVAEGADGWAVVVDSPFNRRIDHNTPMLISGPAAGHDLLKTEADPTGTMSMGTFNNCGAGKTPWGTYLTCEENFNGYFGTTEEVAADTKPASYTDAMNRYGIPVNSRYGYEKFDARFDVSKNPNEINRAGYIVEINPADATSTPVKRTALGRFKHENAACTLAPNGQVVVYLGDDERGEFLYKYVSTNVYVPGGDTSTLLDDGTLFVAKFETDGTGSWIALTEETTGMSLPEVLVNTRMAASVVGATTMDRPEWVAVNPVAVQAYCALTNNSRRKDGATNAGGDAMTAVEGSPNPRAENGYGQIVRWYPANENHADAAFTWDLYVMAGNPAVHTEGPYAGSANVNTGNMFNSPDGMMFDSAGLLWIQTDGNDDNVDDFAGQGNNQMLVGDPVSGEIHRFLTAPNGAEVTGITWSSDRRTAFVGIQHPGGSFPDADGAPRSTVVAVSREDGAIIG